MTVSQEQIEMYSEGRLKSLAEGLLSYAKSQGWKPAEFYIACMGFSSYALAQTLEDSNEKLTAVEVLENVSHCLVVELIRDEAEGSVKH